MTLFSFSNSGDADWGEADIAQVPLQSIGGNDFTRSGGSYGINGHEWPSGAMIWPVTLRKPEGGTAQRISVRVQAQTEFVSHLDVLCAKPDPAEGRTRVGALMQYALYSLGSNFGQEIDVTVTSDGAEAIPHELGAVFPPNPLVASGLPGVYRFPPFLRTDFFFESFRPFQGMAPEPPYPIGFGDLIGAPIGGLWLAFIALSVSGAVVRNVEFSVS